jgi:hypothetical protein
VKTHHLRYDHKQYRYALFLFPRDEKSCCLGEEKGETNCGVPMAGFRLVRHAESEEGVQWRA